MKLCVLMPTFNEARFIGSAIASILSTRDVLDIEIIIVDDGSTDDTAEIVQSIANTTPQIRLIRTANKGVSHARNTLLDAIPDTCDLVTFLDGDDAFEAGYLGKACQILADDLALDLHYAQLCLIESTQQNMLNEPRGNSLIARAISMSIGIYRPSLLASVGAFDTSYTHGEDTDYLLRLFELGPAVHLSNEIAVLYRQHEGSATKDTQATKRGFTRALMGHIRRRRLNPDLASVEGVFSTSQLGSELTNRRAP
ncbi:MAG: glycosyltransferase family 2 protein [Rhodobacteraceae bacterium]|nr:glycosyltransferase family 2 protein [Paracoccaceae bacterium]